MRPVLDAAAAACQGRSRTALLEAASRMASSSAVSKMTAAPAAGRSQMSETIQSLTQRLRDFAVARDWGQFHSPKNLASALSVECGELLEHFQWLTEEQSRHLTESQQRAVAMEVADVFIYLLQLCDSLQLDPLRAGAEKLTLNERKYPAERARGNSRKYTDL